MTEIYLERGAQWYVVMASGHATGREDVCAAISAMLETLNRWLQTSGAEVLERKLEPADALLSFRGASSGAVYDFIRVAFHSLAATAPEAVHVTERDLLGENCEEA